MENSKLLVLVRTFSVAECRELSEFASCQLHSKKAYIAELLDFILAKAPDFNPQNLQKEQAWKHLYPNKPYNDTRIRRLMTDAQKLCEQFIVYKQLNQNQIQQKIYQLQYYRSHKLKKHFDSTLREIEKLKTQYQKTNIWTPFYEFAIEREKSIFIAQQRIRTVEPNLQLMTDKLDLFYLVNKLKSCCYILNYQNLNAKEYQLPLLEEVLQHLNKLDETQHPLLQFYYQALLTLSEEKSLEYFRKMKQILQENHPVFESKELVDMFVFARNYCIKQANKGNTHFLQDLFDLYQLETELGLIVIDNQLSPFTYKNVVTLGIKLKKFEWTENFIETYKEYLVDEFRASTYAFNLARLYFDQGAFEKVIPLLYQVAYKEIFLELSAKTMLMKTYYELEEFDALESFIDSFQMFLRRKKSLAYHQVNYLNLLKFVRRMIRLDRSNKTKINAFKEEVKNATDLADANWLIEKLKTF